MSKIKSGEAEVSDELNAVPAGDFSQWLEVTVASLQSGQSGSDVPCGTCKGCCQSSMFIHIRPEETQTLHYISRALLFPAPSLPKGHVLMGYGEHGNCPMLIDDKCSIYEARPRTCHDFDCRVLAATGISADRQTQAEMAQRVDAWQFTYKSEKSREEHRILKQAAAFLQNNRDLFPPGMLPSYPVQLAALAVRIYRIFADMTARNARETDIAHAIVIVLSP